MVQYLLLRAGSDDKFLPSGLRKPPTGQDPPDFVLEWSDREESFELTEGSTREFQQSITAQEEDLESRDGILMEVPRHRSEKATERWAEVLFDAFRRKSEMLRSGRFRIDHLLIYDMTGLGLVVPLSWGAPRLREKIVQWQQDQRSDHRFEHVSVLRDGALLLDVTGEARILKAESPFFDVYLIRAIDEDDLKRRLRELDRYCRDNSIRFLKLFGSILGDLKTNEDPESDDFGIEDSDLDLLVEFEPGTTVTLFDMARMEREIGDLLGFEVDLRTAEDLSRYFREDVLDQTVGLNARSA